MMRPPRTNARGVSNTRNYQAAAANSSSSNPAQETEPKTQQPQQEQSAQVVQRIRQVPNRVQNFSHHSQKSCKSGRFSICSSAGISHAFHQQDGDEDDMSKYAFSVDGSIMFSPRSKSFNSNYDTGSQYSLTDDEEGGAYYDESAYREQDDYDNNNVPSQDDLELIYQEMRAIRLAEEEELRKAMEASQQHLELEFERQEMQDSNLQQDKEEEEEEYGKLELVSESIDMTEQSSFAETEGMSHLTRSTKSSKKSQQTEKKNKRGLFRRLSQLFFHKKQDKVERAIANANKQKARVASRKNKKMDQYLMASTPTLFPVGMDSNKPRNSFTRQPLARQVSVPVLQTQAPLMSRPEFHAMSQSARGFPVLITGTEVEC